MVKNKYKRYKITDRQWSILLECLQAGLTARDSSIIADISHETLYKRLESDDDFRKDFEKAKLKLKYDALANIKKHSEKTWLASAWLLERKYSDEFKMKQEVKHTGEINKKISIKDFEKSLEKIKKEKNANT